MLFFPFKFKIIWFSSSVQSYKHFNAPSIFHEFIYLLVFVFVFLLGLLTWVKFFLVFFILLCERGDGVMFVERKTTIISFFFFSLLILFFMKHDLRFSLLFFHYVSVITGLFVLFISKVRGSFIHRNLVKMTQVLVTLQWNYFRVAFLIENKKFIEYRIMYVDLLIFFILN